MVKVDKVAQWFFRVLAVALWLTSLAGMVVYVGSVPRWTAVECATGCGILAFGLLAAIVVWR